MTRENWVDERDIRVRLESEDLNVFCEAYRELCRSVEYSRQKFKNTAIYSCFKGALDRYTPRYKSLLI